MSSLVIDLILCGIAYVVLIYFVATMARANMDPGGKKNEEDDDGDGGIEDLTPPKIDLPPGVVWPSDGPKKRETPEMEV